MGVEFSFQTETRMPATSSVDFVLGPSGPLGNVSDLDFAPMGLAHPHVATVHHVSLEQQQKDGSWTAAVAKPDHFTISDVITQFSEATWHYLDHDNIPAAARTVPALGGLQITGFAVTVNQSALIPISTLIDAGNSRPLPFATLVTSYIDVLLGYGVVADQLSALSAAVATNKTTSVAAQLLSGAGFFSDARLLLPRSPAGSPCGRSGWRIRRPFEPSRRPLRSHLPSRGCAPCCKLDRSPSPTRLRRIELRFPRSPRPPAFRAWLLRASIRSSARDCSASRLPMQCAPQESRARPRPCAMPRWGGRRARFIPRQSNKPRRISWPPA
jgi:hypothetical protein